MALFIPVLNDEEPSDLWTSGDIVENGSFSLVWLRLSIVAMEEMEVFSVVKGCTWPLNVDRWSWTETVEKALGHLYEYVTLNRDPLLSRTKHSSMFKQSVN